MSPCQNIIVMAIAITSMVLLCDLTGAATIRVGGAAGWGFAMDGWQKGQTFNVGDVLEFKYDPTLHNVVVVSKEDYESCTPKGKTLNSGDDKVTLTASGTTYYICGIAAHCASAGVKAAITTV
ncbi:unnamed protein product [Cuscuta campestris]|uniref:Phytocyanin domain-containing protein n=1 Tax=Cuscuta campestris TaxID=132261 RepID=A0A484MK55_9ASTE|nr:unnamed protein product [Cuscuta campestris]